ncbi:MAG: hypothetical protein ABL955_09575 [Elusimicrobiota bacterium]
MNSALVLMLLLSAPAAAGDWLADASKVADTAVISGSTLPEPRKKTWMPYVPASRLFSGEIPVEGWWPMEEETATGSVFRLLGGDSQCAPCSRSASTTRIRPASRRSSRPWS